MKSAVEALIQSRSSYSPYPILPVSVTRQPQGTIGQCVANSMRYTQAHPHSAVVSGWMVQPRDESNLKAVITQHYFVYDAQLEKFLDVTPYPPESEFMVNQRCYVWDQQLFDFLKTHSASAKRLCNLVHFENQFFSLEGHWIRKIPAMMVENLIEL